MSSPSTTQAPRLINGAQRSGEGKLIAYGIRDFLRAEFPASEPLIDPLITRKSLGLCYGWRGIGKTHFTLRLAVCAITGTPFFRYQIPKPLNVLLIDGEMPAQALQERIAAQLAMTKKDPIGDLRILSYDLQEAGLPNLANPHEQDQFEPFLHDIDLIILDNLATLARGGKENDSDSWQHIQAWALRQRAAGRAVLFVHHAGKRGMQRGTSAREDVLDLVIRLQKPSDHEPDQGARFEVHFEKNRGFFGEDARPFECHLLDTENGQEWKCLEFEDSLDRQIQVLRDADPKISQAEMARELGCHRSSVGRALLRLGMK